jgi:hypothetical protein
MIVIKTSDKDEMSRVAANIIATSINRKTR